MTSIGPNPAHSFQNLLNARLNKAGQKAAANENNTKEEPRRERSTEDRPASVPSLQEMIIQSGLTPPPLTVDELVKRQQSQLPQDHKQKPPGDATELLHAVAPAPRVDLGTDTYDNQPHLGRQMDIRV